MNIPAFPRRLATMGSAVLLLLAACAGGPGGSGTSGGGQDGGGQSAGEGVRDRVAACRPDGLELQVTAADNQFDKGCLAAHAGQAFTIAMKNEGSERHNLAISTAHDGGDVLFRGDIIAGGQSVTYSVTPLRAGSYHFHCDVHPAEMEGTFIVS